MVRIHGKLTNSMAWTGRSMEGAKTEKDPSLERLLIQISSDRRPANPIAYEDQD